MGKTQPTGEKNGSKRHLLVDGVRVPLALVITGANRHDVSQLEAVLDTIIIERPDIFIYSQHLCLDKGYAGESALEIVVLRGFIPHIKSRGQERLEKENIPGYNARRWVVEVSHSWINRFRKLLVRFEKQVKECRTEHGAKGLESWTQFAAMLFGQISGQHGLRSIEQGMNSQKNGWYHMGQTLA